MKNHHNHTHFWIFTNFKKKTIISFFFFKNLIRISLIRACKFFWLHFNTQKKYTIYRTSYVFLVFNIFFFIVMYTINEFRSCLLFFWRSYENLFVMNLLKRRLIFKEHIFLWRNMLHSFTVLHRRVINFPD